MRLWPALRYGDVITYATRYWPREVRSTCVGANKVIDSIVLVHFVVLTVTYKSHTK